MNKIHTTIELYIIEAVGKRREELEINPTRLALEIGIVRDFVRKTGDDTRGYSIINQSITEKIGQTAFKRLKVLIGVNYPICLKHIFR